MEIKLTETHLKDLGPLIQNKNKAEQDLQMALRLICGSEFTNAQIKDGVLYIELPDATPEAVEVIDTVEHNWPVPAI